MMNRTSLAILFGAMLVAGGATTAQTNGNTPSLASGTVLNAELNATLDSKKAKAGDAVIAHTTEAVKGDDKAAIPKGAKLVGHVTQSSARSKGDSDSALAIKFDKAVLKDGQDIPLSVWVRAIAAEPKVAPQPGPDLSPVAGTGSAAAAGSPMRTVPPPVVGATNDALSASNGVAGPADPGGKSTGATGGLNGAGQLTANSRGVFGFDGVQLSTDFSKMEQGSLITSSGKNVHLDGGTRLLLVAFGGTAGPPDK
jgi:hypothetical protein